MAGGRGTRLWPFSRTLMPKQFIPITQGRSLFEISLVRTKNLGLDNPLIVTGKDYVHIAQKQAKKYFDNFSIISEPFGKNTSAVICLSALESTKYDRMLVMTSDHILDDQKFKKISSINSYEKALPKIVLYGIKPSKPTTSYGYLKVASRNDSDKLFELEKFIEKPNMETAKKFLESDDYLWNSGIFNLSIEGILSSFKNIMPQLLDSCVKTLENSNCRDNIVELDPNCFSGCENISFDYGILEKEDDLYAIKLDIDWEDLGTWKSLSAYEKRMKIDQAHLSINSENNYVKTDMQKVFLNGINNTSVLVSKDAVLVTDTESSENLKELLDAFEEDDLHLLENHRLVHRPWGTYDSVDNGETHQVKRIKVYPGGQLSLQKHSKRSEHWVVVKGNPVITVNESVKEYKPNDYIYIEVGDVHRLENFTDSDVEIIEVQCGSYLGEDDIERLEDIYGRSSED